MKKYIINIKRIKYTVMNIIERVREIMQNLKDFPENKIDINRQPIPPFKGSEKIRLIIIGQDPTVKNIKSRDKISTTLNLDKNGALKIYITDICNALGIGFENVYATNVFKYFYTIPPAKTINVLSDHFKPNEELLIKELSLYPNIPIITLGEPILKLLTDRKNKVRKYWGYDGVGFSYTSLYDHIAFPFPHQQSKNKKFYKDHFGNYLSFVKKQIAIQ